jgi:hypothetical protein
MDKASNILEITGRSLPEDVNTFFNTAISKIILDILTQFEKMIEEGHQVLVRWHYLEVLKDYYAQVFTLADTKLENRNAL